MVNSDLSSLMEQVPTVLPSLCGGIPTDLMFRADSQVKPASPTAAALCEDPDQLTQLLGQWSRGDETALERLTPLVYGELRRLARFHMSRESRDHTLQATELLNEAYIRLANLQEPYWRNQKHFFATASQIMRHILVDYARRKRSVKRGREPVQVPLDENMAISPDPTLDIIAIDNALSRLSKIDKRKAQVIAMWIFGGWTVQEIADALMVGEATIVRDLQFAKVWLTREIWRATDGQ